MKLLLVSDLHRDLEAAARVVERSVEADVVIGAGDFAIQRRGLEPIISVLSAMRVPAVLVPGNGESVEELRAACASWDDAHVLHGSGVEIEGVPFFGLGGGVPVTPFGEWSYDFTEEEASELLRDLPNRAVLVSHSPPFGHVDLDASGRHLGSTAVRDAIELTGPRIVVCGHVHASWTERSELGGTPIVNAGPVGVFVELD